MLMSVLKYRHHRSVTYSSIVRTNVVKARVKLCASWDTKALRIGLTLALAFAAICVQCIPGFSDYSIAIPKSFAVAHSSKVRVSIVYVIILLL